MIDRIGRLSFDDSDVRSLWRVLLDASPQNSPFSLPEFAEAVQEVFGYRYVAAGLWGSRHEKPSLHRPSLPLRGGLLAFEKEGIRGKRLVVPPFTPYTGMILPAPAGDSSEWNGYIEAGLKWLESIYQSVDLHVHPSLIDARPAIWRSWNVRPLYTYIASLSAQEDMTAGWSASARRTFSKNRLSFNISENRDDLDGVVALIEMSYQRHERRMPAPPHRLVALVNRLVDAGLARVFSVKNASGNKLEGGLVVLCHNHTAYYWLAGSNPGGAMTVLLGELWPLLAGEGYTTFDFVGANTPSIAEFKRRFGPDLISYYRLEWRPVLLKGKLKALRDRWRR